MWSLATQTWNMISDETFFPKQNNDSWDEASVPPSLEQLLYICLEFHMGLEAS